jgi:hypothetical protein
VAKAYRLRGQSRVREREVSNRGSGADAHAPREVPVWRRRPLENSSPEFRFYRRKIEISARTACRRICRTRGAGASETA